MPNARSPGSAKNRTCNGLQGSEPIHRFKLPLADLFPITGLLLSKRAFLPGQAAQKRKPGNGKKQNDRIHDPARLALLREAIAEGHYDAEGKIAEILESFLTDLR